MAPVEKVFNSIKQQDLNPWGRSFQSRSNNDSYIQWLAAAIAGVNVGNVPKLYLKTLQTCQRYLLFENM